MLHFAPTEKFHDSVIDESKPPLDYETLRDVIDLALWAGQLLLQNGAESQ